MLVEVLGETPAVVEPIVSEGLIDPGAPPAETWKEQRGL
jgi:hypothetical protein